MKTIIFVIIAAVVCGLGFCASPAQAYLITIQIEAVVDSVEDDYGYLEGKINPGDIITGFYIYESTTPDTNPSSSVGDYWHHAPSYGISLTAGNFVFKTDPANVEFIVEILNDHPWFDPDVNKDGYLLGSYNNLALSNGALVDHISWQLDDPTGNALLTDALLTIAPVLGDWQFNHLRIQGEKSNLFNINAHVTSAIPEPATFFIFMLGGLAIRRRKHL